MQEIWTVAEVAARLKVSQRTIYSMLTDGEMPGFKIRGQWRVHGSQFESWLNELSMGGVHLRNEESSDNSPSVTRTEIVREDTPFLTPKLDVTAMHRRFVEALGDSVIAHSDLRIKPLELDLKHPMPEKVRVYLFNATRPSGGRPIGEHKIQLILPNQARGARGSLDHSGGRFVLLAGYSVEDDVFVLWDAGLYQDFAYSRNVQVKAETIMQASGGSVAVQDRILRRPDGEAVKERVLAAGGPMLDAAILQRIELTLERLRG